MSYYHKLVAETSSDTSFAVRSSATAEDLPDASFAGQQETYLNIRGQDQVLAAIRRVFASLYNDRAISYRAHHGFAHGEVAISAAVQRMVRSDLGASGVMFTLDTESGFRDAVFITSSWGLGEMVVQGAVNPDEFYVHKPMLELGKPAILRRRLGSKLQKMVFSGEARRAGPCARRMCPPPERNRFSLSDADVLELARVAIRIERHYGRPMDIEWGKDGVDGSLHVLQARPETVRSRARTGSEERFRLKSRGKLLASGRAIGQKIGAGPVRIVRDASKMSSVKKGDVLVTDMTDPNWEPVMKLAAAIVTNRGGRTCHAAIIARELGIPAVVGCGDATARLADGRLGHGFLRRGRHRQRLRRRGPVRGHHQRARRDAGHPGQDRHEHRQPPARLRLRAAAERRRRPGAAGIHHQQRDRRASQGLHRLAGTAGAAQGGGRARRARLRRTRAPSSARKWSRAWRPSPPRSGPSR